MSQHKEYQTQQDLASTSKALMGSYLNALSVMQDNIKVHHANWQDIFNLEHVYKHWFSDLTRSPEKISQAQSHFWQDYFRLGQILQEMMQGKKPLPLIEPDHHDKRFRSSAWHEDPYFFFLQQSYLLMVKHFTHFIQENKSKDPKIARQVSFFSRQVLDAISPTNFMFSNPDAIKHFIETKGESFFQGYKNLLDDIADGNGQLVMKMSDKSAFTVGENIAVTPGKIIFQNELFQLIQYSPSTASVYQRPLLIVPPWINKYYILDLKEKNSFVKWVVDQGYTVFMISWVNPGVEHRDTTFDDYVIKGILAALDAITLATNEKEINALGFCIGGTLLATTLAYMKEKQDNRIVSTTFLTTLIDFTDPGEIEVFIDEPQLKSLERKIHRDGYLDGRVLMATFNMLRENDLIWPYYVNNYLCGKNPVAFDMLYWNADCVNLPEKMLSFYLRNMYLNNLLIQEGGLCINGVDIDISKIDIPAYFLSTEQDHIAPWQTTFMGAVFLTGPTTFVLGGSGHIAGVVNPPSGSKYGYHYSQEDVKQFMTPQDWLANSEQASGSWWEHWHDWLKSYAGKEVKARVPGEGKLPALQDAPGDYVKKSAH
ncbi:MAG: PHA/PHB synthase family protein [Candidatus Berkiella sp.]